MYYAFSLICIDFSIRRVVIHFSVSGRGRRKKGKKPWDSKNQYLKYLFFPLFSCDVCGVITHSAGYVWFSIQFRLSKTSGVFAFSPLHPLFQRFMGPIIIHLFISISNKPHKTNTWMNFSICSRGQKIKIKTGFSILCYRSSLSQLWLYFWPILVNFTEPLVGPFGVVS